MSGMSGSFDPRRLENVAVFIDGTNFYKRLLENFKDSGKDISVWKVRLDVLVGKLLGSRKLVRIYFYTNPGEKEKMETLILGINNEEWSKYVDVKLGTHDKSTNQEKRVDALLVVDLLKLSFINSIDTAILISADEDFIDAVKTVKDLGKHVEIASFEKCNKDLRKEADVFHNLRTILLGEDNAIFVKG